MAHRLRELTDRKTPLIAPRLQFSLRTVMLSTAGLAITLLAVREINARFGFPAAGLTILGILSIVAHVAGAALGGRLRSSPYVKDEPGGDELATKITQPIEVHQSDFAPTTQLSHHRPLNRKPIVVAVCVGASCGAVLASSILTLVMWDDLAIVNVLFGAFSASVIGGLFGFWVGSLFQVVRSAVAEAQESAAKPEGRSRHWG